MSDQRPGEMASGERPAASGGGSPTGDRRRLPFGHWPLLAALTVAAALMLWDLGQHPFWSDEAITAAYARSLLRGPLPSAWDGRNLICFGEGVAITDGMRATTYPMLEFYVVAPFFALCGTGEVAGRLPFVLCGLATIAVTYAVGLRLFGGRSAAGFAAALLAGSAAFILFSRQCRYYTLTSLLPMLLLLQAGDLSPRRPKRLAAFVLVGLLLFHSHFLVFFCFMGGLTAAFLLLRPELERVKGYAAAGVVLLLLTVPWTLWTIRAKAPRDPATERDVATLLGWYLRDLNRGGFVSLVGVAVLLIALAMRTGHPRGHGAIARSARGERDDGRWTTDDRQRPSSIVSGPSSPAAPRGRRNALALLVLALVQLPLTCLVTIQDTAHTEEADLRYVVNLIPLFCLLVGWACARLEVLTRGSGAAACALCMLLTLDFVPATRRPWPLYAHIAEGQRVVLRCYLYDWLYELAHPEETTTSTRRVIEALRAEARQDETALVEPSAPYDMRTPLMYYLGDRLLFCGILSPDGGRIAARNPWLRRDAPYLFRGEVAPDWIVKFGERGIPRDVHARLQHDGAVYRRATIPVLWRDLSRPEILWHQSRRLPPVPAAQQVIILRKAGSPPPGP